MLLFDYQDRRPYGRIGYPQNEGDRNQSRLGRRRTRWNVYAAVPKFSHAFIARLTIHYHYATHVP